MRKKNIKNELYRRQRADFHDYFQEKKNCTVLGDAHQLRVGSQSGAKQSKKVKKND